MRKLMIRKRASSNYFRFMNKKETKIRSEPVKERRFKTTENNLIFRAASKKFLKNWRANQTNSWQIKRIGIH